MENIDQASFELLQLSISKLITLVIAIKNGDGFSVADGVGFIKVSK